MFGRYRFGSIEYGNKEYNHDIIVHIDGSVSKREKSLSREKYGTSHILSDREIEKLVNENPDVLVVGCGEVGALKVSDEAKNLVKENGIKLVSLPTPEAIKKFNKLKKEGKKVNALIHVTC